MTSSTRSMSVRISWIVCPAEISVIAGDMKELRNPWKTMIEPRVNSPRMVSHTPTTSTAELAMRLSVAGMAPRYWFTRA